LTSSRWFESNREKRLGVKPLHLSVPRFSLLKMPFRG
jgi:hypothetical protein